MSDPFDHVHELLRKGRRTEALDLVYNKAEDVIEPPYRFDLNHAWYVVADILYKERRFEQSKSVFEKSLVSRPDDVAAIIGLANCYVGTDAPAMAVNILSAALSKHPFDCTLLYNYGNCHFDLEQWEEAIEAYEKVLKIEASDQGLLKSTAENLSLAKQRLDARR